MKRSWLLTNTEQKIIKKIGNLYIKQRNYWVSLLRKTKNAYYENLDETKVSDNLFWKTIKPSLSENFSVGERTSLSENGEIVKTEKGKAQVFNQFLGNIVKNL